MPRSDSYPRFLLLLTVLGLAGLAGCSEDSVPRSVLIIESINDNEVLDSDVYNNGEDDEPGTADDFVREDQVSIVIRNRPHDRVVNLDPDGPFGAVVLNRYEIRFRGDETLPALAGAIHLRIPSGSTETGEITVIPSGYKVVPPLVGLLLGGEIQLVAEITLIGEEDDSHDRVEVKAQLPVHVANWVDPD